MLRDRVAAILPAWNASMHGYPSILAMHAFGLEENGDYRHAELVARGALALDAGHPGAIHVLAHVMEMQGRTREGLTFLAETERAWIHGTGLSVHLAWHRALFHLEVNDSASALSTYDALIATAPAQSMNALTDASALLWRLQLANVNVQARWRILADRWNTHAVDAMRPFHAVHAMMAFAAASRTSRRRCRRKRWSSRSAPLCSHSCAATTRGAYDC